MNVCMNVCVCVGGWGVEGGNRPYNQESLSHASLPEG